MIGRINLVLVAFATIALVLGQSGFARASKSYNFPLKNSRASSLASSGLHTNGDLRSSRALRYRLTNGVKPIHYDIKIRPVFLDVPSSDFSLLTIPGEVRIILRSTDSNTTNTIQLNIFNINITEGGVSIREVDSGSAIPVSTHSYDEVREQYIIGLGESLKPETAYELYVPYIAEVGNGVFYGLYLGNFIDPVSGGTKYLASTQLQPASARAVFPSFDEPDLKATFQLTIGRHTNFQTLSNTELNNTVPDAQFPDWVWDTFNPTLKMSTYLVAITITDFTVEVADPSLYDKPVRVYAPAHIIDNESAKYPALAIASSLQLFDSLFDIKYGLPKMDSVAVPQFEGGAMENWGLNIYGFDFILYTPGETVENARKLVTLVTGHEVAHQWFGNLVTCKWWSDVWLNEGFARYIQYWPMRLVAPEFEPDTILISDVVQPAMVFDQSANSHPVKNNASTPAEIEMVFDKISYDKGSSLMRMMEAFLTPSAYLSGINLYLQNMQYQGAEQDDLFAALQQAGGQNLPNGLTVKEIMETWTFQAGFPVVRVYAEADNTIRLVQEEFKSVPADYNKTWHIPVKVISAASPDASDKRPDFWLPNSLEPVQYSSSIDTNTWIVLNPDQIAYFRVWYDPALLKLIENQLQQDHEVFSPGTRSMLIEDAFNFFFEDNQPLDNVLNLASYMRKETHGVVWFPFLTNFLLALYIQPCRSNSTNYCLDFMMDKIDGALNEIGWEQPPEEKGLRTILRERLLQVACRFGNPNCTSYMNGLFDVWFQSPKDRSVIPADLRQLAFCVGVATRSEAKNGLDPILHLYNTTKNPITKRQLRRALGCAKRPVLSNYRILDILLEGEEKTGTVLSYVVENNIDGKELIYRMILDNYGKSLRRDDFVATLESLAPTIFNDSELEELTNFIQIHKEDFIDDPELQFRISNSILTVEKNVKRLKKY